VKANHNTMCQNPHRIFEQKQRIDHVLGDTKASILRRDILHMAALLPRLRKSTRMSTLPTLEGTHMRQGSSRGRDGLPSLAIRLEGGKYLIDQVRRAVDLRSARRVGKLFRIYRGIKIAAKLYDLRASRPRDRDEDMKNTKSWSMTKPPCITPGDS
jgi:hypothetical protein